MNTTMRTIALGCATLASIATAQAQTKYFARQNLEMTKSSGQASTTTPALKDDPTGPSAGQGLTASSTDEQQAQYLSAYLSRFMSSYDAAKTPRGYRPEWFLATKPIINEIKVEGCGDFYDFQAGCRYLFIGLTGDGGQPDMGNVGGKFCTAWRNSKPAGAKDCDNYRGNHILIPF